LKALSDRQRAKIASVWYPDLNLAKLRNCGPGKSWMLHATKLNRFARVE